MVCTDTLLQHVRGRKDVLRCRVIILLSRRAGLRAGEIAKLEWSMISDPNGKITHTIELEDRIAKKRSGRRILIHSELRAALVALQRRTRDSNGPVVKSRRGSHMCPNSVVCWFKSLYNDLGYSGGGSHSGRRTFLTETAITHVALNSGPVAAQSLAWHSDCDTNRPYIEVADDIRRNAANKTARRPALSVMRGKKIP